MLWTEKYRPKKINELIGQPHFVMDAEHWIKDLDMPNVLLYGVAGTGKTTAGLVLANSILDNDFEGNFFEINASDDPAGLSNFLSIILQSNFTRSIFFHSLNPPTL